MTTNNKKVILEFPAELVNMTIKPEFEGLDKNGDPTIYRLISGTKEIIKENQFINNLLQVYLAGGWPCGWEGEYPKGRLVVFSNE